MRSVKSPEALTYAFANLASRDEVVFKSIVGLLSGRTQNQWQHVASGEPDLLIVGCHSDCATKAPYPARAVLKIAYQNTSTDGLSVQWPLRANDVFERLEQVAKLLNDSPSLASSINPQNAYKLTRWPPQEILSQAPGNLRLATLLGAGQLNAEELSQRSGLSLEDCLSFLHSVQDAGLLLEEVRTQTVAPANAPQGFFARLRAHLGLSAS